MHRPTSVLLAVLLLLPAAASAQHRIGAGLAVSDPRGEFDQNTDTGWGLAAWYRYGLAGEGVLSIGVNGAFQSYGSARRRAPLSGTIPDIRVDVETTNNTSYVQGAVELEVPSGAVRPYAMLAGGLGAFYTTTTLEDPFTDRTVLTHTNQSDWTWIWGAGGGVRVRVHEAQRPGRRPSRLFVDVGAMWQEGDEVEYLREGTLVTDQGEYDIDRRIARSEVELMLYRVGVTYEF